jgi:hypothetical protein
MTPKKDKIIGGGVGIREPPGTREGRGLEKGAGGGSVLGEKRTAAHHEKHRIK